MPKHGMQKDVDSSGIHPIDSLQRGRAAFRCARVSRSIPQTVRGRIGKVGGRKNTVGRETCLGTTRKASRRRPTLRRRVATAVVVFFTGMSIAGYVVLSLLVNSPPPPIGSNAWAAVVQPVSESQADNVTIQAQTAWTLGNFITYTVWACGPHPYHAQLLMSGLEPGASADYLTGNLDIPRQVYTPSTSIHAPSDDGGDYTLTGVQVLTISLPYVLPCSESQGAADAFTVSGVLTYPWLESSTLFSGFTYGSYGSFWHGPHASLALPTIGDFDPGIGGAPVPFTMGSQKVQWTEPHHEQIKIEAGTPLDWTVESAMPSLSGGSIPTWSDTRGISPTAQFSDQASIAIIQDAIVVLAIIFGIGGGLLASLLFEFLRPRRDQPGGKSLDTTSPPRNQSPSLRAAKPGSKLALTALGALLLVGYIRRRRNVP